MYTFVDSVSLSRSTGSQWEHVDLSDTAVTAIFSNYIKVYLILTNPAIVGEVYVDLDTIDEHSGYVNTLAELLVELGSITLTTVAEIPDTDIKHVRYDDAVRAGYHATIVDAGIINPPEYPTADMEDIELTRPHYDTDLSLLHSHTLVSINGYYHMTDTDGEKAFVYDAAITLRQSQVNHIGITSFLDVGELTKVKLDPLSIVGDLGTEPLIDKVYFTVPDDLEGKSYILILGGYAIFIDPNVFWRTGDHTFALDLNKIPYIERIFESSLYMDMSDLGLTEYSLSPDAIALAEIQSDTTIRNYMTLSQSYLVIVDTPNLLTNKIHLRHSNLPGMFTAYQDPTMPLFVSHGKLAEYWKVYEDSQWAVSVQDSFLRNYIISMQANINVELLNNHLTPMRPYKHSRGYLLDILGHQ